MYTNIDNINNLDVISQMGYFSYEGYLNSSKGIEPLKPKFTFHIYRLN